MTQSDLQGACPFCGSSDSSVERSGTASAYNVCSDCFARGPVILQENDDEEMPVGASAIAAWNQRADLAANDAEIARLREALEPFAKAASDIESLDDEELSDGVAVRFFRLAALRRARALHERPEVKG